MSASEIIPLAPDWVSISIFICTLYLAFSFLDLEFETESNIPAPEPALYETAYVTSHKGNCRAGCFSSDGQLIATGSVDASIKILDVDRMLAKSAPDEMDPSRGEQQGHPVIRTLYDHMEEVTCLEFHPKEPVLCSGSKDNTIKLFDISKASVKKAFKTITVSHTIFIFFCIQSF